MTYSEFIALTKEVNVEEYIPNGMKVSETNNPFVFLAKHTYQVGSSEIVAICSNAIAVGTGQTGSAPLYVFCKDGIYALFVDANGELAYINSRIIARDVCNNTKSVTPIDSGVVFTTDRGLMMIAGNEVKEIGQAAEGDFVDITDDKITDNAYHMVRLGGLPSGTEQSVDFLRFVKNAIVNYNHNERELMVSNILRYTDDEDLAAGSPEKYVYDDDETLSGTPVYNYTYIMDRDGNWSRRNYTADEYINNYPTSYRLQDGYLYQVDNCSDEDNGVFICSREIKLDSIGFKELNRFVTRGFLETGIREDLTKNQLCASATGESSVEDTEGKYKKSNIRYTKSLTVTETGKLAFPKISDIISIGGDDTMRIFGSSNFGSVDITVKKNNSTILRHTSTMYRKNGKVHADIPKLGCRLMPGTYVVEMVINFEVDFEANIQSTPSTQSDSADSPERTSIIDTSFDNTIHNPGKGTASHAVKAYSFELITYKNDTRIGLYIYGSYDARNWVLIGHREKAGSFNDIGCLVERCDCKFFKFVLAGRLKSSSRLDYFEVSSKQSKLYHKIR